MLDINDPETWEVVLEAQQKYDKNAQVKSDLPGQWKFTIKKIHIYALDEDTNLERHVHYFLTFNWIWQSKYTAFNQHQNIKQALKQISIDINMSEQKFRQKYGFWSVQQFTVHKVRRTIESQYQTYCSFISGDHAYYGKYQRQA